MDLQPEILLILAIETPTPNPDSLIEHADRLVAWASDHPSIAEQLNQIAAECIVEAVEQLYG